MKKLLYAVLLVGSFVACSDDDEKKVFAKADLYGSWKATVEDDGCYSLLTINETEFTSGSECDGTKSSSGAYGYSYENNTITLKDYPFEGYKLVVTDLNSTTLKVDHYLSGVNMGSETFAKVK